MPLLDFRSVCFPYCLDKQEDGSFMPRNREYRHLGYGETDKDDYTALRCSFKLSKTTIKKISFAIQYKGLEDWRSDKNTPDQIQYDLIDRIYLYNDGCVPTHSTKNMNEYLKKLALLAKEKPIYHPDYIKEKY